MFLSLLLSAFLPHGAINMLNLPDAGAGGGGTNKNSSSRRANGGLRQAQNLRTMDHLEEMKSGRRGKKTC